MRKHTANRILAGITILAFPTLLFWQRQAIFDWSRLQGYNAPAAISQLAAETSMDPDLKRLFYVYHPALLDKTNFNSHCRQDELTIVLGCYVSNEGIYLLDVTDDRLAGVEQVTAAHETLHAVYERLNSKERTRVDKMTKAAFDATTDKRIRDTVELYRKEDPAKVPNELHSILGTEVRTLPKDLEEYYKQYFNDRLKVVGYSEQYEQAFTERKNQVEAYDAELASLKTQIESLQSQLDRDEAAIASERSRMDNLKDNNQIDEYNAAVPGYNNKIAAYNSKIKSLANIVARYNDIVPKRNEVANEEQELVKAIDSRETVPAAQ